MADKSRTLDFYIRLIHETGQAVPGLKSELDQITKAAKSAGKQQQAVFTEMFANVGKGEAGYESLTRSMSKFGMMMRELRKDAQSATPQLFTPDFLKKSKITAEQVVGTLDAMGKRGAAAFQRQTAGVFDQFAKQAYAAFNTADPVKFGKDINKVKLNVQNLTGIMQGLGVDIKEVFKQSSFGTKETIGALLTHTAGQLALLRKTGRAVTKEMKLVDPDAATKEYKEVFKELNDLRQQFLRKQGAGKIGAAEFFGIGDVHRIGQQLEQAIVSGNTAGAADLKKRLDDSLALYRKSRIMTEKEVAEAGTYYSNQAITERARLASTAVAKRETAKVGMAGRGLAEDVAQVKALRTEMKALQETVVGLTAGATTGGKARTDALQKALFRLIDLEKQLSQLERREPDPTYSRANAIKAMREYGFVAKETTAVEVKGLDALAARQMEVDHSAARLYQSFERLAAVREKMSQKELSAAKKPDRLVLAESDVQRSITALERYNVTASNIIRQARADFPSLAGMFEPTTGSFKLASVIETKGKEAKGKLRAGYRDLTVTLANGNEELEAQIVKNAQKLQRLYDSMKSGTAVNPKATKAQIDRLVEEQNALNEISKQSMQYIAAQDKQFAALVGTSRARRLKENEIYYAKLREQVAKGEGDYQGLSTKARAREVKRLEAVEKQRELAITQERLWQSVGSFSDSERTVWQSMLQTQMDAEKTRRTEYKKLGQGVTFMRQVSENIAESTARVLRGIDEFRALSDWLGADKNARPVEVSRLLTERLRANVEKGPKAIEENGKALLDVAEKRAMAIDRATKEVLATGAVGDELESKLAAARRAAIGRKDVASLIPKDIDTPLKTAMFEAFAAGFKIHRGELGKVLEAGIAASPGMPQEMAAVARGVAEQVQGTFSAEFAKRGLLVPETIAEAMRTSMRRASIAGKGGKIQQSEFKIFEPLIKQALSFNPELTQKEADAAAAKMVGITAASIRKAEGKLSKVSPEFIKTLTKLVGGSDLIEGVKKSWSGLKLEGRGAELTFGGLFEVGAKEQAAAQEKISQLSKAYSVPLAKQLFSIVKDAKGATAKIRPQLFQVLNDTFSETIEGVQLTGSKLPSRNMFSQLIEKTLKQFSTMAPGKNIGQVVKGLSTQLEAAADELYATRDEFQKAAVKRAELTGKIIRAERDALVQGLGREAANAAMVRAAGKGGGALIKQIFEARERGAQEALKDAEATAARGGLAQSVYESLTQRLNKAFTWDAGTKLGISAKGNVSQRAAEQIKQVLRDMALAKPVTEWTQADVDKMVSSALGLGSFKKAQGESARKMVNDMFAPILADMLVAKKEFDAKVQNTMAREPQKGPQVVAAVDQPFALLRQIAERQADAAKLGKREKQRYVNAVLEQNKQYDEIAKAQGQRAADEAFLAQAQANEQKKEAIRERMRSSAAQDARDMENLRNIAQQMRDTMSPQEIKAAAAEIRKTNDALATLYDDIRTGKERGRGRRKLEIESRGPAYTPEELAVLRADTMLRNEEAAELRRKRKINQERIRLVKAIIAEERRMESQIAAEKAKAPAPKAAKAAAAAPPVIPPVTPPPAAIAGDADESAKAVGQAATTVSTAVKKGRKVVAAAAAPDKGKKTAIPAVTPPPEDVAKAATESKHAVEQAGTVVAGAAGKAADKVTKGGKGKGKKPTVLPVTPEEVKAEAPPVIAAIENAGDKIGRVIKVISAGFAVKRSDRKGSKIFPNIEGEAKAVYDELTKAARVFKQGQAAVDQGTQIADPAAYQRAASMISRVTEELGKAGINMRVLKDGTLGFYNAINLGGAKLQNLTTAMSIAKEAKEPKAITNIAASAKDASALVEVLTRRLQQLQSTQKTAQAAPAAKAKVTKTDAEIEALQRERALKRMEDANQRYANREVWLAKQTAKATAAIAEDALQKRVASLAAASAKAASKADAAVEKAAKDPRVLIGQQIRAQLGDLDQRFNQLSYRFQHMGWQLGLVGGVMVAGFMKTMKAAAELNRELTKTAAIMEANATVANKKPFVDYYNEAKKAALEWSTTTIFAATEVNQAMLALAQAGQAGKETMLLPKMLEFAAAGDLKLADAVRASISAMTAFKLSAEEIGVVTNAMTVASISTNAEVQDMADAFKHVGPIAAMAGMEIEATAAAVGRLSQAGIRGSMAGTGLKRALSELMAPTGKAAKYLHALNIEAVDLATGTLKPMPEIIDQFRTAFDRLGPSADKAGILMEIFGMRAGPAMVALINESGDQLRRLEQTIISSSGKMAEIAGRQYESLDGYLKRLGHSITNFRAIAGEQTDWSVFKGAVEVLTNLVNTITKLVDESRSFKIVVGGLLLVAGAVGVLATVGGVLSMMVSGLGTLATVIAMFMKGNNLQGFKEIWAELKLLWQTDKALLKQQSDSIAMLGLSVKELNYYMAAAAMETLNLQKAQIDAAIAEKEMALAVEKENAELLASIELLKLRKKAIEEGIVAGAARMATPPIVPPAAAAGAAAGVAATTGGIFTKLFASIKKSFAGLLTLPALLFGGFNKKATEAGSGIAKIGEAGAKAAVGLKGFWGVLGKIIARVMGPVGWIINLWLLYDVIKMFGGEIVDFVTGGKADELEESAKKLEAFKDRFTADRRPLTVQELIGLKSDPEEFNKYQNEAEKFLEYWTQIRDSLDAEIKNKQKTIHFVPTELRDLFRAAELKVQTGANALGRIARIEQNAATALGNREAALERIQDMLGKGEDKDLGIKGLLGSRTKDLDDILAAYEEVKSQEEEITKITKANATIAIDSLTGQKDAVDDLHDAYSVMYRFLYTQEAAAAAAFKDTNKSRLMGLSSDIIRIESMSKLPYRSDTTYQAEAVRRLEQYGQERIGLVTFFMQGELNEIKKAAAEAKDAEFENMVDVKKLKALIYGESLDQLRKYYKDAAKVEKDYEKQSAKLRNEIAKTQIEAQAMLRDAAMPDTNFLGEDTDFNTLSTKMSQMNMLSDQFNQSLYQRNEFLKQGNEEMAQQAQAQAESARSSMTGIKKQLASEIALRALKTGDRAVLHRLVAETRIGKEMDKQVQLADRLKGLTDSQKDWERLKFIKEAEEAEKRMADSAADIPKQQLAALTELRDVTKQFMTDISKTMEGIRDMLRELSVVPGISMFKAPIEDSRAFNEELTELLNQLDELANKGDIGGKGRTQINQKIADLMSKREAEQNPLLPTKANTESAFKALDSSVQASKGKAVDAVNEVGQAEKKWIETNADLRDQRTEQSKQKALGQTGGAAPNAAAAGAAVGTATEKSLTSAAGRFSSVLGEAIKRDVKFFGSQIGQAFSGLGTKIADSVGLPQFVKDYVDQLNWADRTIKGEISRSLTEFFNESADQMEKRLIALGKYPTILQSKVRDESAKAASVETILLPKPRDVENTAKDVGKQYGKGIETAMGDALKNLDEAGNRLKGTFTMKDGQIAFIPFAEGMQDAAAKSAEQISGTLKSALTNLSGKGFITQLGGLGAGEGGQALFSPLSRASDDVAESLDKVPEPADQTATALKGIVPAADAATAALNRTGKRSAANTTQAPPEATDERGFATGGHIDGYGGGDIVPALLEPGEFVLRKEAVKKYGAHRIDALNKSTVPRFKEGGMVGEGWTSVLSRWADKYGKSRAAVDNLVRSALAPAERKVIAEADPYMAQQITSDVNNVLGNATKSLASMVYETVAHPVEQLEGMGKLAIGAYNAIVPKGLEIPDHGGEAKAAFMQTFDPTTLFNNLYTNPFGPAMAVGAIGGVMEGGSALASGAKRGAALRVAEGGASRLDLALAGRMKGGSPALADAMGVVGDSAGKISQALTGDSTTMFKRMGAVLDEVAPDLRETASILRQAKDNKAAHALAADSVVEMYNRVRTVIDDIKQRSGEEGLPNTPENKALIARFGDAANNFARVQATMMEGRSLFWSGQRTGFGGVGEAPLSNAHFAFGEGRGARGAFNYATDNIREAISYFEEKVGAGEQGALYAVRPSKAAGAIMDWQLPIDQQAPAVAKGLSQLKTEIPTIDRARITAAQEAIKVRMDQGVTPYEANILEQKSLALEGAAATFEKSGGVSGSAAPRAGEIYTATVNALEAQHYVQWAEAIGYMKELKGMGGSEIRSKFQKAVSDKFADQGIYGHTHLPTARSGRVPKEISNKAFEYSGGIESLAEWVDQQSQGHLAASGPGIDVVRRYVKDSATGKFSLDPTFTSKIDQAIAGEMRSAIETASSDATRAQKVGGTITIDQKLSKVKGMVKDALNSDTTTPEMAKSVEAIDKDTTALIARDDVAAAAALASSSDTQGVDSLEALRRFLNKVVSKKTAETFAVGGGLDGYGGGDIVPAMLEPGEYVMRKEAVRKYGAGLMSMINGLKLEGRNFQSIVRGIRGFKDGGAVTAQPAALSPAGVYNLNLTIGGRTYPLMGEKAVIGALAERLRREGLTTK